MFVVLRLIAMCLSKRNKFIFSSFILIIFILFCVVYIQSYPAIIFNTDDWCFITFSRSILPQWEANNPCRVLPECLMPACSWLAATFIMPFNHDLVNSIAIITGLVIAVFLTAYFYFSVKMLMKRFNLSATVALFLSLLFILLHYLVFRKTQEVRMPLFAANSLTHVYFYLLPDIANATLVLIYLAGICEVFHQKKYVKIAFLILVIYFALFSNLYASIMLPVFVGSLLLVKIIFGEYRNGTVLSFIKKNLFELIILLVWAVVQFFEINGGRSKYLSEGNDFSFEKIYSFSMRYASYLYHNINHIFLFAGGIAVIISVIVLIVRKKPETRQLFQLYISLAISFIVSSIYIILVCIKAHGTIEYHAIIFAPIFFWILIVFISISILIKSFAPSKVLLPVICLFIAFQINSDSKNFARFCQVPTGYAKALDDYIISSIVEADNAGQEILVLDVPDFGGYDNFPLATYGGGYVARALEKFNITSTKVYVEFHPNSELNERFHL